MMKAGDNYIIEIEEVIGSDSNPLAKIKGFNALVFDQNGLDKLIKLDKILRDEYNLGYEQGLKDADAKMADEEESPFNLGDVIMAGYVYNDFDFRKAVGFYNGKFKGSHYMCLTNVEIGKTYENGIPMGLCIDDISKVKKMIEESDNEQ